MADGINIVLPGDKEFTQPVAGATKVTPQQLKQADNAMRQAAIEKEAEHYEEVIEETIHTSLEPYKDDAPLCDNFVGTTAVTEMTEHLGKDGNPGPISMPRWTHGQCIGPECARWKTVDGKPICGKALGDLAAAAAINALIRGDIEQEFARWAYPDDEEESEEEEEPDATE